MYSMRFCRGNVPPTVTGSSSQKKQSQHVTACLRKEPNKPNVHHDRKWFIPKSRIVFIWKHFSFPCNYWRGWQFLKICISYSQIILTGNCWIRAYRFCFILSIERRERNLGNGILDQGPHTELDGVNLPQLSNINTPQATKFKLLLVPEEKTLMFQTKSQLSPWQVCCRNITWHLVSPWSSSSNPGLIDLYWTVNEEKHCNTCYQTPSLSFICYLHYYVHY